MSYNLFMFIVLFGASFIPWLVSFSFAHSKDAQIGLLAIDFALTMTAYLFLWWAIGWWILPVTVISYGVGKLMEAAGIRGYDLVLNKKE